MKNNAVKKILVIDDEANIREGLRQTLSLEGYQVELAENGRVGLEKLQQNDFSAVISDLKMPLLGGFEVLKTIQILQPEVPVIIITGFATGDSGVDAMKNGAADYLTKPFIPAQIINKVRTAISRRHIDAAAHVSAERTEELQGIAAALIGNR